MRLYLVQHGEAKAKDVDPMRGLTDKGTRDAEKVAAFIKPLQLGVSAVWHSGKTRAVQTAEIMGTALSSTHGVFKREGLAPMDPVAAVADGLAEHAGNLMMVGHLPFMGLLASLLLTGSESSDAVAFQQGGVVCLERDEKSGWRVRWIVTPDLL